MNFVVQKRERTRNFTEAEKKLLLDIVQQHLEVVEDKSSKCKIKIWQNITHEFNSAAIFGFRTWKQLRYLYKNMKKDKTMKTEHESYKKTTSGNRMPTLLCRPPESVENCSSSSNVYYEELPVIIESVPSVCHNREDSANEMELSDSEPDHLYRSDPLSSDIESSSTCLPSKASNTSAKKTVNYHHNLIPDYTLKNITCAEDIIWKRLELKFKKEIHDYKLKAMKVIHEQDLKAKQEIHEQELITMKQDHELEKNIKQKLLELESENWTKRNRLLDLEIALKEKQLNK